MKARAAGIALVFVLAATACSSSSTDSPRAQSPQASPSPSVVPPRVLLFTKTAGFKHSSIPVAADALARALPDAMVTTTGDAGEFTDEALSRFDVVVFLITTGDVLNAAQQAAFERWIGKGGGFAGVHSATDTEYDWPWYQRLVGATFKQHPRGVRSATLVIKDASHPSTSSVPSPWKRADEWYDFRARPGAGVHVLVTVDESTYAGGTMGKDHPIAWCLSWSGGRSWYTAMGHASESWKDPTFVAHVAGGVLSVVRGAPASCA